MVTAKKTKLTYIFEVIDVVCKAVKLDGISLALASRYSEYPGKSAVQIIVLGGPYYDQLEEFQRYIFPPRIMR